MLLWTHARPAPQARRSTHCPSGSHVLAVEVRPSPVLPEADVYCQDSVPLQCPANHRRFSGLVVPLETVPAPRYSSIGVWVCGWVRSLCVSMCN